MRNPKPQSDVVEYHKEHSEDAASVGGYVRVCAPDNYRGACFGPMEGQEELGWKVVEIDWENREYVLAPNDFRERMVADAPEDRLDREHHNAPKDGNDDPVFDDE